MKYGEPQSLGHQSGKKSRIQTDNDLCRLRKRLRLHSKVSCSIPASRWQTPLTASAKTRPAFTARNQDILQVTHQIIPPLYVIIV